MVKLSCLKEDSMLKFEKISTDLVYEAHRVKVYNQKLRTPDGTIVNYDLVKNRNGAGVLLVDNDGKLIFVKQYRTVIDDIDIEIAAGCLEYPEEPFEVCARREAEEETGYIPEKLTFVNNIIAAVGVLDERTAVFIGTDLKKGNIHTDDEEFIDLVRMDLDEAVEAVYSQKIIDSKTIIAILAYKDLHSRNVL